jgi:hypothetical protein
MWRPKPWPIGFNFNEFASFVLKWGVNIFEISLSRIPIPLSITLIVNHEFFYKISTLISGPSG